MADTLTIVADQLNGGGKDGAIDAVLAEIAPSFAAGVNRLERASSLQHLEKRLDAQLKGANAIDPEVIQIVGHGLPGTLWLGRHWAKADFDAEGKCCVLDGNPNLYGILQRDDLKKREVWLLGCAVGVGGAGAIASGPAVLIDLALMWGTKVGAPLKVIGPKDFTATTGRFSQPDDLLYAEGRCLEEPLQQPVDPTETDAGAALIRFERVIAVPGASRGLPPLPSPGLPLPGSASDWDLGLVKRVSLGPILAAPESVYRAHLGGVSMVVEVLANGTLLRTVEDAPRMFLVPAAKRLAFRKAQARLVGALLRGLTP